MTIRETLNDPGEPAWWKDEPFRVWAARAIRLDKVAFESCGKLLAVGIEERELLEFLVGRAVWAFHTRGSKPWYSRAELTADQVDYFPNRLRAMADEIEELNRCLSSSDLYSGQIPIPARGFGQMPELLRRYAHFISIASRKRRHYNKWAALDELIQFVEEETGEPRFPDLSNILTAVANDAGVDQCHFDTDALKQRPYRKRKLSRMNSTRRPRLRKK